MGCGAFCAGRSSRVVSAAPTPHQPRATLAGSTSGRSAPGDVERHARERPARPGRVRGQPLRPPLGDQVKKPPGAARPDHPGSRRRFGARARRRSFGSSEASRTVPAGRFSIQKISLSEKALLPDGAPLSDRTPESGRLWSPAFDRVESRTRPGSAHPAGAVSAAACAASSQARHAVTRSAVGRWRLSFGPWAFVPGVRTPVATMAASG